MIRHSLTFGALALAVTATPFADARAQYYGPAPQAAPLYPYAVQPGQPYAVEVAPGTFVIQRPNVRSSAPRNEAPRPSARAATRNDPKVIEELRDRHAGKRGTKTASVKIDQVKVINTRKVVRLKPIVIETTRVVDDPPKVIVRKHYVDDTATTASLPPARGKRAAVVQERAPEAKPRDDGKKRVIEADAEVTILGPDRMSIRLFRKGQGAQAKAGAGE